MTIIGIDPGVTTGWAECIDGTIVRAESLRIWELIDRIRLVKLAIQMKRDILIVVEDARLARRPSWVTKKESIAKAQGAGWIRILSGQIEDCLKQMNIPYKMVKPSKLKKLSAVQVQNITGYKSRTNEHTRDAILIAWQNKHEQ